MGGHILCWLNSALISSKNRPNMHLYSIAAYSKKHILVANGLTYHPILGLPNYVPFSSTSRPNLCFVGDPHRTY